MIRALFAVALIAFAGPMQAKQIEISLDTGEAEAVLGIVDAIATSTPVTEEMWNQLWTSKGYQDLKYREDAMGVGFTDEQFRQFVKSGNLVTRREALRKTLEEWKGRDMEASARRALLYLPAGATIHATVYPLIKPKRNSFVFKTPHGKAIFLYLDPDVPAAKFENTVTHELHHIGYDTVCSFDDSDESTPRGKALLYLGGFGEGYAMLAAAGSADVHPHATSSKAERAVWDRNVRKTVPDIARLEQFFSAILSGKLHEQRAVRREFIKLIDTKDAPQGAFYTVGWTMASTIERERGRKALVSVLCDPVSVLDLYQSIAVKKGLPAWSPDFLRKLPR